MFLVDNSVSRGREGRCFPGMMKKNMASGLREVILHLSSALVRLCLKSSVHFWSLQFKKDRNFLERAQQRATEMITGLEHLLCEERLRDLSLEKTEEGLSNTYKYLKGGS